MTNDISFPRLSARTQRFTLGEPRNFTVSSDGGRLLFLRSDGPTDAVNKLWLRDIATSRDVCIADPGTIRNTTSDMTPAERARRERLREGAGGITGYTVSSDFSRATFSLGGQLFVVDLDAASEPHDAGVDPGVFDPKISPAADTVAFVRGGSLCVADFNGSERVLCAEEPHVTWGMAEFIAAEEMQRMSGYWWSPDGRRLIAARVDVSAVAVWHIADPARPASRPTEHRYPAAGTTNARVDLFIVDIDSGEKIPVTLPSGEWEYINSVHWSARGALVQLQTRDQRTVAVCDIECETGVATVRTTDSDAHWVEIVSGSPSLANGGALVTCTERNGARQILVDDTPVTPLTMHVRQIVSTGNTILFVAHSVEEPASLQLWRYTLATRELVALTPTNQIVSAWGNDACHVIRETSLSRTKATFACAGSEIHSNSAPLPFNPQVTLHQFGGRRIPTAVVTPRDNRPGPLPVLMNPYGGPHAQRVMSSAMSFAESQWFADQGFIVVIVDGAGTPGHGSQWEREVYRDLASPVLADQVEVLSHLASVEPRADLTRVAIRGWSFGGYLAALAVLREPQHFHCAIAGAPVTEWRLYDTHYTERYLGNPSVDPVPYDATSLLPLAHRLERPLLLVHGLADDNVVAAHTLQLSDALLAAGKPHEVLPLSGVTHMTPQEHVAENLVLHQLDFLRRHLGE